jgi:hypothetical protein
MSGDEVSLRIGSFTEKELDLLGVSCCGGGEFARRSPRSSATRDRSRA